MTTAKTFAPILAVLAALPAADALCAPDRAGIQTRWLAGQIESARTTDNAAVERDAFRRLLSMSPDDAELQLDYLRHLFRYDVPGREDEAEVAALLKKLCASPDARTCRDARTLERVTRGDLAQSYAALRLLAVAGRHDEAAREAEKLFQGVPPEPSLQLEYADMLLRTETRRAEGKALLETLRRSPSLFISQRAQRRLADEAFEEALERALEGVYQSATRAECVATLERLLGEKPDDPRSERWRNAIAEGRYWLANDRGDALLKRGALTKAEAAYREALAVDPSRPFAYAGLADVALRRGDRSAAQRLLEKAVSLTDDSQAAYRAVLTRRIAGIHQDALVAKADRLAPRVDAEGNFLETPSSEYVAALRRALDAGEADPWTTGRLARALWARGEFDAADRLWKTQAERAAPSERGEWRYAEALFRRSVDQPEKAVALAEDFLARLPARPRAADAERIRAMRDLAHTLRTNIAVARAESLAEAGRFAEALRALPDDALLESWRLAKAADWARQAGDPERAQSLWQKAAADPAWREEAIYGEVEALLARARGRPESVRGEVVRLVRGLESENDERGTLTAKSLARMTGALDDAGAADGREYVDGTNFYVGYEFGVSQMAFAQVGGKDYVVLEVSVESALEESFSNVRFSEAQKAFVADFNGATDLSFEVLDAQGKATPLDADIPVVAVTGMNGATLADGTAATTGKRWFRIPYDALCDRYLAAVDGTLRLRAKAAYPEASGGGTAD